MLTDYQYNLQRFAVATGNNSKSARQLRRAKLDNCEAKPSNDYNKDNYDSN